MTFAVSFLVFALGILSLSFAFMVLLKAIDDFMPNLSGLVYNWVDGLITKLRQQSSLPPVTNRGVKEG
jgi:hypothetical protein